MDLYLTNFGANQLFRNNCNGTFADVSRASGTDHTGWAVSAAFVDFDRDGWLDLFVGHYLFTASIDTSRASASRDCQIIAPRAVRPSRPGSIATAGTARSPTSRPTPVWRAHWAALGAATADFNGDGWIDIFVANDQQENQMWINQRNGAFENLALLSGTALSASGAFKANMGVDAGDFDNDGDEDLFVTELIDQGSTLYVNDGTGMFEEHSARAGIRLVTLPFTGFGAGWLDYDNDGWLDVLAVNGLVTQNLDALGPDNRFPLQQSKVLLRNMGTSKFEDVTIGPARYSSCRRSAAARRSATSTTTATRTSSWRTMRALCAC